MPEGSLLGGGAPLVLPLPWRDPAAAFGRLAGLPCVAWLDSQTSCRARYSVLAPAPYAVLAPAAHAARLSRKIGGCPSFPGLATPRILAAENPFDALRNLPDLEGAGDRGLAHGEPTAPFAGGAIGFLGYECGAFLERTPRHPFSGPDFFIGLHDVLLLWDHASHRLKLVSTGLPETEPAARLRRAQNRAAALLAALEETGAHPAPPAFPRTLEFAPQTPPAVQKSRIARAIGFIEAGDIFQANITTGFRAPVETPPDPAAIYLALRAQNPAPFGAFLGCGADFALASVSPERFLSVSASGAIEARPIKGSRPRGASAAADAAEAAALLASAKDHAENLMIADLLRNDIGRVAAIGSISVPELAVLETFPRIHHLVSSVRGQLLRGASAVDLLRAAFPGGSITGAPKIRAMEIIHALEGSARGPYCGSLFWLGADGAMDSSILIRTAVVTPNAVTIQAGGAITADSDPDMEYEECLLKAAPLLAALSA